MRAKHLREIGVFGKDTLSREPTNNCLDLYEADDGKLAKLIVSVNDSDITTLTHAVLEGIHLAISLELSGNRARSNALVM